MRRRIRHLWLKLRSYGGFDILLAYEPSEEAKEYMKEKNVELEMTPIGVDALVFIVSAENPVTSQATQWPTRPLIT